MSDPRAKALKGGVLADDVWAAGYLGEIDGQNNPEDVWLAPRRSPPAIAFPVCRFVMNALRKEPDS